MPIKGDLKKDFLAIQEMVKGSLTTSARFLAEQTMKAAARDGILQLGDTTVMVRTKKGKNKLIYISKPQMDVYSKGNKWRKSKKLFHHSKFINRTGNLLRSLTPAGWSGSTLNTQGYGSARVERTGSGVAVKFQFDGRAETALKAGSKQKGRVEITDEEGRVKERTVRRRIFESASRSVNGLWNSFLKKDLDKRARALK